MNPISTPRFSASYRLDPNLMTRFDGSQFEYRYQIVEASDQAFKAQKAALETLPDEMTFIHQFDKENDEEIQLEYKGEKTWFPWRSHFYNNAGEYVSHMPASAFIPTVIEKAPFFQKIVDIITASQKSTGPTLLE